MNTPTYPRRPLSGVFGRLGFLLGVLAFLCGSAPAHAATTLNFSFDDTYTTSAGVFKSDGTLVRTLWRKTTYAPGSYSYAWDDKTDSGATVPVDTYTFKIIYHNIDYTWEGVIGNTSTAFSGVIRRGFIPIVDMSTDGTNLYSALGYNEGQSQVHVSTTAAPNTLTFAIPASICTTMGHVASDGTLYYMANTGGGFDAGHNATFIIARKVSDNTIYSFANGTSLCMQYFPGGGSCYPDHNFASCIDIESGNTHPPTGLAVQKTGSILAVSHGNLNEVRLIDKTTGFDIGDIVVTSPRKIAFAPNGDLWVISGTTVQRFDGATLGTTNTPVTTISGFASPQSVSVHPSNNDVVMVADAGTSQQVKAYTRLGTSLWTYGTLGGGYATDPTVTTAKLAFIANRTFVTVLADGSFWVSDPKNNRSLHFSSSRTYIDQILYIPASYVATSDPNVPSRVIGGDWMEFEVDYSKPLLPGDPTVAGGNNSWKLKKNWGLGVPADYHGTGNFEGIHTVVTLGNGRTYGLIWNFTTAKHALVELPASGNLRITGIEFPFNTTLYANGDLRSWSYASPIQTITNKALTGFDGSGNPTWGAATNLAVTSGGARYPGSFSGPTGPRFPITSSNLMVSFNSDKGTGGMHLGAAPVGGTTWKWLASPAVATAYYETYAGQDGTFSQGNGVQYAGNQVHASGRNIVYGYHGEFYNGGQANQFMHFRDDGLFLGQFGTVSSSAITEANPGQGGNSFSLSLVKVGAETYFWNNDESNHAGVHRWRFTGLNNVGELSASGTPGSTLALGSSSTVAPSQIKDNAAATGVVTTGTWTTSTNTGFYGTNFFHDQNTGKGTKSVRFTPTIPVTGDYQVYTWWVSSPTRATNTPIDINHVDGTSTVTVNQRLAGGKWNYLGTYRFTAGTANNILVRNDGTDGYVIADAFRFIYDASQIRDNADATGVTVTGAWTASTFGAGLRFGSNYLQDDNTGKGAKSVRFTPTLEHAGSYEVFAWWTTNANRATNVPFDINHSGGTTTVAVNQQLNGAQWRSLGVYNFAAGTAGNVLVRTTGTSGYVIADAVRFVKQP